MRHFDSRLKASPRRARQFLATTLLSAALLPAAALAQAAGQGAAGATAPQRAGTQQNAANAGARPSMTEQDRELIQDLVHANLAEIETGRLALDKSSNPQVRQFAQKMIDDHTLAHKELAQLAQRKGAPIPEETDFQHKAIATALRLLSGNFFDDRYLRHVGVNDHRRTVDLLQKTQQTAQDPDLKAYAAKTLPVVQRHLAMARQMAGADSAAGGAGESRTMGAGDRQQPAR